MDSELSSLSSILERFDPELYCKRTGDGVVRVYHRKRVWRPIDLDGDIYLFPAEEPYHVFSLTDSWGFNGRPRKWGSLPIWEKLRSLEDRDRAFSDVLKSEEIFREKESREIKNLTEDMALEMRDAIKKDAGDVLTHSLDTKKDKRRIYEKRSF